MESNPAQGAFGLGFFLVVAFALMRRSSAGRNDARRVRRSLRQMLEKNSVPKSPRSDLGRTLNCESMLRTRPAIYHGSQVREETVLLFYVYCARLIEIQVCMGH